MQTRTVIITEIEAKVIVISHEPFNEVRLCQI